VNALLWGKVLCCTAFPYAQVSLEEGTDDAASFHTAAEWQARSIDVVHSENCTFPGDRYYSFFAGAYAVSPPALSAATMRGY
jgi:hypothetical protein